MMTAIKDRYLTNRFNFSDVEDSFVKEFLKKGSMDGLKEFSQQYFSGFYKRHPLEVARRAIELSQETEPKVNAGVSCVTETSTKSLVTVGTKSRRRVRFQQIKKGDFGANTYKSDWTPE
jgi:hypothetical protein